jgi:hypothetical protein
MNAKDRKPSQELHSREELAPVFADLNSEPIRNEDLAFTPILRRYGQRLSQAHNRRVSKSKTVESGNLRSMSRRGVFRFGRREAWARFHLRRDMTLTPDSLQDAHRPARLPEANVCRDAYHHSQRRVFANFATHPGYPAGAATYHALPPRKER